MLSGGHRTPHMKTLTWTRSLGCGNEDHATILEECSVFVFVIDLGCAWIKDSVPSYPPMKRQQKEKRRKRGEKHFLCFLKLFPFFSVIFKNRHVASGFIVGSWNWLIRMTLLGGGPLTKGALGNRFLLVTNRLCSLKWSCGQSSPRPFKKKETLA